MDWKAALMTFVVIFISEVGDKTQLATMAAAAHTRSPSMVFIGAALALVLSALLGVLGGDAVVRLVPLPLLRTIAGAGFILFGLVLLLGQG